MLFISILFCQFLFLLKMFWTALGLYVCASFTASISFYYVFSSKNFFLGRKLYPHPVCPLYVPLILSLVIIISSSHRLFFSVKLAAVLLLLLLLLLLLFLFICVPLRRLCGCVSLSSPLYLSTKNLKTSSKITISLL